MIGSRMRPKPLASSLGETRLRAQITASTRLTLGHHRGGRSRNSDFREPVTVPRTATASSDREMLQVILEAEREAVKGCSQRANDAEAFGDKALVVQLEGMVREESVHAEGTERMLSDWPV